MKTTLTCMSMVMLLAFTSVASYAQSKHRHFKRVRIEKQEIRENTIILSNKTQNPGIPSSVAKSPTEVQESDENNIPANQIETQADKTPPLLIDKIPAIKRKNQLPNNKPNKILKKEKKPGVGGIVSGCINTATSMGGTIGGGVGMGMIPAAAASWIPIMTGIALGIGIAQCVLGVLLLIIGIIKLVKYKKEQKMNATDPSITSVPR